MRDSVQEPNRSPHPSTPEPWSVEQDAEHLMDDLFANVDVLLEGSSQLPRQPISQLESSSSLAVPVKATAVTSPPSTKRTLRTRPQRKTSKGATAHSSTLTWPTRLRAWRTRLWVHLDKVCFGIACVSLGGAVVWLVQQSRLASSPTAQSADTSFAADTAVPPLSPEDAQFTQYMLRSLRVIDQQPPQTSRIARAAQGATDANGTVASNRPQVIERIYIPVYPSATANSAANAAPVSPSSPSPADPAPTSDVTPAPVAPQRSPAPAARRSELPLPSLDALPPLNSVAPVPLPNDGVHSFAGIIQAGDRTTVLFTVDGKTQRLAPGEVIGSSGWTLVSADGQTAVIRRNGEVRSVYSGQRF